MNELLLRRRVASAKSLPYDAEIEYLESSGTQYINTKVRPNKYNRLLYYAEIMWDKLNARQVMCTEPAYFGINSRGKYESYSALSIGASNSSFDEIVFFTEKVSGGGTDRGYIRINTENISTVWHSNSGFSNKDTFLFRLNGSQTLACYCKLRKFKIYDDLLDAVYFDAIPVRVGTTGYMYDKVSGTLFGNAGTGSFILGQDV